MAPTNSINQQNLKKKDKDIKCAKIKYQKRINLSARKIVNVTVFEGLVYAHIMDKYKGNRITFNTEEFKSFKDSTDKINKAMNKGALWAKKYDPLPEVLNDSVSSSESEFEVCE